MDPLALAGATAGVAAGIGAAAWMARSGIRAVRRLGHAVDDLIGEPARPETGQPERPGLMRRLASIEADQRGTRDELRELARRLDVHLDSHAAADRLNGRL